MKTFLVLVFAALAVCLFFIYLSITAKAPNAGLVDGRLKPCPDTPNCVSSESGTADSHRVDPLFFGGPPEQAWNKLKKTLAAMDGVIVAEQAAYLHVAFTSRIFRFVDDMEFRLVSPEHLIHLRSASRVGHSDLGVNRKRVDRLREKFAEAMPKN